MKPTARAMHSSLVIILVLSLGHQLCWALFYDPEQQDGIPVLSARSVDLRAARDEPSASASDATIDPQRRQDPDLDDATEDDDDDEDAMQSGSVNRESRENPSYGESQRAERDGDEIESFFDRHLGAPQQNDAAAADSDESRQVSRNADVPSADPDDFEAAASGPIASLLHNLIFHHGAGSHADQPASDKKPAVTLALASNDGASKANEEPETAAAVVRPASELAGALLAPVLAAPSALVTYEPSQSGAVDAPSQVVAQPGEPSAGGVQQIYIGRRPTVMSYLQHASAADSQRHLVGQQAMAYYSPQALPAAGSINAWHTPHTASEQQHGDQRAASHAHRQQQRFPAEMYAAGSQPTESDNNNDDDDDHTVVYGLSFGSKLHSHAAPVGADPVELSAGEFNQQVDPEQIRPAQMLRAQQQQQYYQHQMAAAGYVPYSARYKLGHSDTSSALQQQLGQPQYLQDYSPTRQYQRQQQQQYGRRVTSAEALARTAAQLHAAQAQANSQDDSSARYSARPQMSAAKQTELAKDRQRLLASLGQELRSSSTQQQTQAASLQRPQVATETARQPLTAFKSVRRSFLGDHLNSYNAIHTEVSPHKSFTTSARMVSDAGLAQQAPSDEAAPCKNCQSVPSEALTVANLAAREKSTIETTDRQGDGPNLLTGRLATFDASSSAGSNSQILSDQQQPNEDQRKQRENHLRVRRDDSEDRDDADDDGVWVDDDDDDDNRQQSSDVNEASQEPEEEEDDTQNDAADNAQVTSRVSPPGIVGGPHGYELSPNDLMIYNG